MFSWAPLLVMGPGTVYRLYPPLDGTAANLQIQPNSSVDAAPLNQPIYSLKVGFLSTKRRVNAPLGHTKSCHMPLVIHIGNINELISLYSESTQAMFCNKVSHI